MASNMDILEYAISNMRHRQLKSWLTVLGIVIGIGSIVLLVSIGQGLDHEIKNQLSTIGTRYIIMIPGSPYDSGFTFGPPQFKGALYQSDADAIRKIPGVKSVSAGVVLGVASLEYRKSKAGGSVVGVEAFAMEDFLVAGFEKGKYLAPGDENGVILGYTVAQEKFDDKAEYGKTISINGKDFKVKGILKKGGSFSPFDSLMFIDISAARELGKTTGSKRLDRIFVMVENEEDLPIVEQEIIREISRRHKVTEEKRDFVTNTPQSISDTVGQITGLLSYFLGLIASISLVVGMVGIANAMFTSVLERTREIGILKAVGATEKTITRIFLFESGLIGLVGGAIGVIGGAGLSFLLSLAGVPSFLNLEFMLFCLLLSILVGLASGYFPSKDAAKLQPVESLRYE